MSLRLSASPQKKLKLIRSRLPLSPMQLRSAAGPVGPPCWNTIPFRDLRPYELSDPYQRTESEWPSMLALS